jgi:hypothetical protein
MTTSDLRTSMKNVIADARVASTGDGSWTIRFADPKHLPTVRGQIKKLGLVELFHDIEGSQWDWSYVFHVAVKD